MWVRWRVNGRVQGVGFRRFVQRAAGRHGVVGDVCNLPDGHVEIRASGTDDELQRLFEDVRRGPGHSRVDGVQELAPEPVPQSTRFEIRSRA